ncbi:MAG: VOC family protein [Ardenticatenaceae bacterium]|nr:VOC family protein [Ardenticatenaceae bacterium]
MIHALHHAQITIPPNAESEARTFYCDFLGLPEIEKPDSLKTRGGFWLQVGSLSIHVGVEDGFNRYSTKAHLAYEVTDLEFWRAQLTQKNIKAEDGLPIPGFVRFEFRDPFGNRVEFIQAIAAHHP